jgi:ribose transport system substrate-binding protein
VLTACGRDGTTSGSSGGSSSKGLVIGWSQSALAGSDWYKTLIAGGQYEAKKLGAKLEVLDANRNTTQQNQDVQTLIARNADVMIMDANDPLGVASSVRALKKDKIPLVAVNASLDKSLVPDTFCFVAEDQVATGAKVGKQVAQQAIARFGKSGTMKLVAIGGYPGDVTSELRYTGFKQGYNAVMKSYPKVHTDFLPFRYGQWLPNQALAPISDVATANPDLKIVFSESDVMQAGVQQALQRAGLWNGKIIEGSYDGGMNSIKEMVGNPSGPLQGDGSNQPWDQGIAAVKMAVAAYHHQTSACPTKTNYVGTTLVTPANAKQYYVASNTYVRSPNGPVLTHG